MNRKLFWASKRLRDTIVTLIGAGLLVMLAFSFNALFAFRNRQSLQTTTGLPDRASPIPSSIPVKIQSDNTQNWNVLTDDKQGYSIKYPPTLFYKIQDTKNDPLRVHKTIFLLEKYKNKKILQPPEIGLVIYDNKEKLSLQEWLNQNSSKQAQTTIVNSLFEKVVDIEQISAAGFPALKFVEESPVWDSRTPNIILAVNDKIFRLFYVNVSTNDNLSPVFDTMVNSLRLTQ